MDEHREHAGHQRLVVVGHGLSAALWVAATFGLDAVGRGKSLRMPDGWEIDLQFLRAQGIEPVSTEPRSDAVP